MNNLSNAWKVQFWLTVFKGIASFNFLLLNTDSSLCSTVQQKKNNNYYTMWKKHSRLLTIIKLISFFVFNLDCNYCFIRLVSQGEEDELNNSLCVFVQGHLMSTTWRFLVPLLCSFQTIMLFTCSVNPFCTTQFPWQPRLTLKENSSCFLNGHMCETVRLNSLCL